MDQEFLKRLLATFRIESEEHVSSMSARLIKLESIKDKKEIEDLTEDLYREAHSLKGAARAVGIMEIEAVCRTLETVFSTLKKGSVQPSREVFDLLHRMINLIHSFTVGYSEEDKISAFGDYDSIVEKLNTIFENQPNAPQIEESPLSEQAVSKARMSAAEANTSKDDSGSPVQPEETVRIPAWQLDSLLLKVEDLLSVKISFDHMLENLNELSLRIADWKKDWNKIRLSYGISRSEGKKALKGEELLSGFIEKNSGNMAFLEEKLNSISRIGRTSAYELNSKFRTVSDEIRNTLMFPASYILEAFPKIVRDLSAELGREVRLELSGRDVKVDRRILDELKEPLIHLIRNAVDHGVEPPAERIENGKAAEGRIFIGVAGIGGSLVEITVSDDGKGIATESLKDAALRRGIISQAQADQMDDAQAMDLIFMSEVSSSPVITDISGRGLGMPIVKEKVNKLGGSLHVHTTPGKGTTFRLSLPVTLTTLRGVIVKVSEQLFVVPSGFVEQISRIKTSEIKTAESRETVLHNNMPVSLIYLQDLLGLRRRQEKNRPEHLTALIVSVSGRTAALAIDSLIDEGEVLFKPFNKQLQKVRNLSGATILGSGRLAVILNPDELMDSIQAGSMSTSFEAAAMERGPGSILVADDSITSRILLKDILESAGYNVTLAVDGVDALARIKTGSFDLIVTDVEMPRMNGFDLTRSIRQDDKLKSTPVVLITALSSPEDKTRGIDSGADAYVVKSSFDQSNLLEVIQRLI
ncbi:MAG TPA: response regulator [Ignavibacteriales bacterium]|nr:response regulator [Ignavibacteriales bacterium]